MMYSFKIGDKVDVIDRRDGTVVDWGVTILDIKMEELPYLPARPYATLSSGYSASVRCLRPAQ